LQVVRRQPEEFDGQFYCPWGEVHSYYADGSFEFSRNVESIGWVCFLEKCVDAKNGGEFWRDRLRYINAHDVLVSRYQRPGVLLKPLMHCVYENAERLIGGFNTLATDDVLVLQDRYSLAPPAAFPPVHTESIKSGSTVLLSDWRDQSLMCSRMRLSRFHDGNRMPPPALYAKLVAFLAASPEPTPHDPSWAGQYEHFHHWLDLSNKEEVPTLVQLHA